MIDGAAENSRARGGPDGAELLEQSLRVLDGELLGPELEILRYDLSLENRRATQNAVCTQAAARMRETGLGLKAATVTPEGADASAAPIACCARRSTAR